MKKNLLISIIVSLLILLVGCNSETEEKKDTSELTSEEISNKIVIEEENEEKKDDNKDTFDIDETVKAIETIDFETEQYRSIVSYSVAPSVIDINDQQRPENNTRWIRKMHISYPMIYNFEGDNWDKEKNINNLILQELTKKHNFITDTSYVDVNIEYRLYDVTDEYMSIMFYGYYHSPQEYHDVHLSVNIDIRNEKIMNITDVIADSVNLIDIYNDNQLILLEDEFGGMNDIIYAALEVYSKGFPHQLDKYDFYLDGDYIGLIVTANREKTHMSFGISNDDYWHYE